MFIESLNNHSYFQITHSNQIDIDRYKRMVGMVYLDSRNINLEMVKEGLAWAYKEYLQRPYASEYLDAEKEARSKSLGLWQQVNPQPPWEFRKLMRTPMTEVFYKWRRVT